MAWEYDWAWSLPLIVATIVFHVAGLSCLALEALRFLRRLQPGGPFFIPFSIGVALASLFATLLLAVDAMIWAAAYRLLGALPDVRSAMLYSLSALTSYGHAELYVDRNWQLMGALEAVNGMLLFGLTTAFLFAVIERMWSSARQKS